jgi:hypothetical protein
MDNPNLTLQTAAAFERVYDSIIGNTKDDLSSVVLHLKELIRKANEVEQIHYELNN